MAGDVNLGKFRNNWYHPGRNMVVQMAWFFSGLPLLRSSLLPFSAARCWILRSFGAKVGVGVVIKPGVRVKYPWLLKVGKNSWLGEDCWIDNMALVEIGENVCVSQGAYLCTGNHDWSDPAFGLVVRPIVLRDGAWVGAMAVLCPGVRLGECAVAATGSVVTKDIPNFEIHGGNPARFLRKREIFDRTCLPGPETRPASRPD
jgi:putative colanic acid biosynthesis acetyltransferase WcaF